MFIVVAALVIQSLQPLRTMTVVPHQDGIGHFGYARDAQYEYLSTPRGLYRARRVATDVLELTAFANEPVSVIASDGETLYAGLGLLNHAYYDTHSFFRSRDRGATFTPIDDGLHDCSLQQFGEPCRWLVSRQIELEPGRIFIEASGNVLVSGDDGATWPRLFGVSSTGRPAPQTCPVTFETVGRSMLLGGECPLDFGWIGSGTLREDRLGWDVEPLRFDLPIENRNVQFIRHVGDGVVYASIEGALLKSTDGGTSWRSVIHYPLSEAERYPYAAHFLVTPRVLVLGGFDKKNITGYLAYSTDGGESWTDATALVGDATVELLAEDADGRLLVGLLEGDQFTLAEMVLRERKGKRRAARP